MRETFIPRNFIVSIQSVLYKGLRPWFAEIFFAALIAYGSISEWIRKSCNEKKYRKFYHSVQRLGRFDEKIQNAYNTWLVKAFKSSLQETDAVRLALDDSPIKRYGSKIEGAGYMHDPTNVTDKNAVCYGHSWVVISLIVKHAQWGTISLPFRWNYYIRKDDLEQIDKAERPEFKTKPQIGITLLNQVVVAIRKVTNKPIQLAFDSGYVSSELFEATASLGVEVITRFKKNSNFYKLPVRTATVKRGRPRKYGEVFKLGNLVEDNTIKTFRAELKLYGGIKKVEYKSLVVTTRTTNGRPILLVASRYVQDKSVGSWSQFVSTNISASPLSILLHYSRRFSIEEMFKDLKEVCGLGRQEVRKWSSCKACATITALNFAAVEIWAWKQNSSDLTAARPHWDNPNRRPSHKDKRNSLARKIGVENFLLNISKDKTDEFRDEIIRLASFLGLAV